MGRSRIMSRCNFLQLFVFLQLQLLSQVYCNQYKVGDLDAWNIPTSARPDIYTKWPQYLTFNVGDSLLFLYPPSQDSVILVTEQSYKSCNLKDPILTMNDGNSLFNITCPGEYYFTSGMVGHCQQLQKLHISATGNASCTYTPTYTAGAGAGAGAGAESGALAPAADSPSSPSAFGSIPMQETASSSSPLFHTSQIFIVSAMIALFVSVVGL